MDNQKRLGKKMRISIDLGTMNVRSLEGKKKYLEEEFKIIGLDKLTITETKKKV